MLRPEEIFRVKFHLGVNVLLLGSEPFIAYLAIFDKAIQPFLIDPSTTSATIVQACTTVPIVLAAVPSTSGPLGVPAFSVGSSVVVDVGPAQEIVTIQVLTGTSMIASFQNAHGTNGAYPVVMSGGEQIVRELLARIAIIEQQLTSAAPLTAGLEQADEARFFPSTPSGSRRGTRNVHEALSYQRDMCRDELGDAVGFPNLRRLRKSSGSRIALY